MDTNKQPTDPRAVLTWSVKKLSSNLLWSSRDIGFCRSLIKVKFSTDQFRPALGSCCCSINCHHAQKTSKLPYFRLFRPDTQILSALTALYWPSTAFYWPSTTKYQPVTSHTDPVPSWIKHYRLILIHCHQVPTRRAPYWPSTIMDQPVSPTSDPVPPSTDQNRPTLTQYHQVTTTAALYWPSTTK